MSWLFSRVLVEEYLGENSLDGEPFVQLSGSPTQQAYLSQDKMTGFFRLSRFGMTFKPLTESRGEELLTLYLEDFHAKTSVQQDEGQELMENEAECGEKWRGSFAKYNPDSRSWKTHQCSLLGDLEPFLGTWPRWGLMRDGECWGQQMLERTIKGTGFGSLLPTPTCHNAKEGNYPAERNRRTPLLATHVGGKIHPEFTEWMMGWPLGWTDLKPLETGKSHCVQQQHGGY